MPDVVWRDEAGVQVTEAELLLRHFWCCYHDVLNFRAPPLGWWANMIIEGHGL